jgi:pyrimidine deaminase RibD-like protein
MCAYFSHEVFSRLYTLYRALRLFEIIKKSSRACRETLEPCAMCAGALVAARVERLVFGARDLRFGGVRSKFRIADSELLNHRVEIVEGVLAVECVELLQGFFARRR